MKTKVVTRQEIYDAVWSEPMTKVGKNWGISDVAVRKICTKLNVPRPPQGYWAKLQAGHKVSRMALPKTPKNSPEQHVINPALAKSTRYKTVDAGVELPDVEIPETLDAACSLVKKTSHVAKTKYQNDRGMYFGMSGRGYLDVSVSRGSLDRALKIMEAINSGIKSYGLKLEIVDDSTVIRIEGEVVKVRIEEKANRLDYEPTPEERAKRYFYHPKWRYEPSARLTLMISNRAFMGYRSSWADAKIQRVEDKLPEVVKWLGDCREAIEAYRQECEEHERQRKIDEELRRQERQKQRLKEKRVEVILEKAELAEELDKLRHLIGTLDGGSHDLEPWRALAIDHAGKIESKLLSWPDFETAGLDSWELRSLGGNGWS